MAPNSAFYTNRAGTLETPKSLSTANSSVVRTSGRIVSRLEYSGNGNRNTTYSNYSAMLSDYAVHVMGSPIGGPF